MARFVMSNRLMGCLRFTVYRVAPFYKSNLLRNYFSLHLLNAMVIHCSDVLKILLLLLQMHTNSLLLQKIIDEKQKYGIKLNAIHYHSHQTIKHCAPSYKCAYKYVEKPSKANCYDVKAPDGVHYIKSLCGNAILYSFYYD